MRAMDWEKANTYYNRAFILCAGVVIGFLLASIIYLFMGGFAK